MKFGCCMGLATFVIPSTSRGFQLKSLSLREKLGKIPAVMEALEKNGFDFVEAEVSLVAPEGALEDFKSFKKRMSSYSIKPEVFSAFVPPDLKVVGPGVEKERLKRYLALSFYRAREVGGEVIIWGSGSSRSYPVHYPQAEASKQIEEFLNWAADLARESGIHLAIEPMNKGESNMINSLQEALTFVNKMNRQEIKVMVDFYHMMMEKEKLTIVESCKGKIIHVHLSDKDRRCPGDGDYPFYDLFKMMKNIDYQSRISLECNFQDFARESKRGLEFVKGIWERTKQ